MINSGGTVELDIGDTELYLVTFQISSSAKSGEAKLHFDNGSDRFTCDNFDIQIFPQPSLTFTKVVL